MTEIRKRKTVDELSPQEHLFRLRNPDAELPETDEFAVAKRAALEQAGLAGDAVDDTTDPGDMTVEQHYRNLTRGER